MCLFTFQKTVFLQPWSDETVFCLYREFQSVSSVQFCFDKCEYYWSCLPPPPLNRDAYDCVTSSLWVCPWAIKAGFVQERQREEKVSRKCRVGWRMNENTKLLCVQVKEVELNFTSPCLSSDWLQKITDALWDYNQPISSTLPTDNDTHSGTLFQCSAQLATLPVPKMHRNIQTPVIPSQKTSACTGLVQTAAAAAAHI